LERLLLVGKIALRGESLGHRSLLDSPSEGKGLAQNGRVADMIAQKQDEPGRDCCRRIAIESVVEANKLAIETVRIGEIGGAG
jgi:hypothetical protein